MSTARNIMQFAKEEQAEPGFVFLGGTVNGSTYRKKLIPLLNVKFFDPVVDNWTTEDVVRENQAKHTAQVLLYVITPKQMGFYAPVEAAVNACTAKNQKVVITFMDDDDGEMFNDHQKSSNMAIKDLLLTNLSLEVFDSLEATAEAINRYFESK